MSLGIEYKSVPLEIKELDDEGRFEGWGAVFGEEDEGGDTLVRGLFKKSLVKRKPKIYLEHHSSIGVYDVAVEKKYGLWVEGQPDESPDGLTARMKLKSGALDSLSVGFRTITEKAKPGYRRDVIEANLYHVGIVPFGLNEGAVVTAVKSLDLDKIDNVRELEHALRDVGLSQDTAKKLCSVEFLASLKQRDVVDGVAGWAATIESAVKAIHNGG